MPWSPSQARMHNKSLTDTEAELWCEIANGVLRTSHDEGKAIRVANAKINDRRMRHRKRYRKPNV